jgi:hypothetical protein
LALADLILLDFISLDLILEFHAGFSQNRWGSPLGWLLIFLFLVGVPIVSLAYRGRLDVLTGPWISCENVRHD